MMDAEVGTDVVRVDQLSETLKGKSIHEDRSVVSTLKRLRDKFVLSGTIKNPLSTSNEFIDESLTVETGDINTFQDDI